jgi:hypothetical protein
MVDNNDLRKSAVRQPGIPIDYYGGGTTDPTKNVETLVTAESKRQDDLRVAAEKLADAHRTHADTINKLRARMVTETSKAETRRMDEISRIRADYSAQLSKAEAGRIDAIRAVDVNAVSVASQRAADQATVLATQVAQSAEALRALVATTATTTTTAQQQMSNSLSARITTLEQGSYQAAGKQSFSDPAMVELLAEVKRLSTGATASTVRTAGIDRTWGVIAVVIALIISGTLLYLSTVKAPVVPLPVVQHTVTEH